MSTTTTPSLKAAFPSGPLTDAGGNITPAWRGYFQSLYVRTGNAPGASSSDAMTAVTAERNARSTADAGLTNAIAAERTARENADTAEATARAAGDAGKLAATGGTLSGPLTGTTAAFSVSVQSGTTVWRSGTGVPAFVAPVGSIFSRTDGTVGATIYISRGAGTWLAVAGV